MKKKTILFLLITACAAFSLAGCRKRIPETEAADTETAAETESETEKKTEQATESETKKAIEPTASAKPKASASPAASADPKASASPAASATPKASAAPKASTAPVATQQCPYCYQQIPLTPNGDGTTVYSVHVAQEKAWADTYGYGDQPPAGQQTDTSADPPQNTPADTPSADFPSDIQQCPVCYQWFTVSDGSFAAHQQSAHPA